MQNERIKTLALMVAAILGGCIEPETDDYNRCVNVPSDQEILECMEIADHTLELIEKKYKTVIQ